jgi:hypothetical protein
MEEIIASVRASRGLAFLPVAVTEGIAPHAARRGLPVREPALPGVHAGE